MIVRLDVLVALVARNAAATIVRPNVPVNTAALRAAATIVPANARMRSGGRTVAMIAKVRTVGQTQNALPLHQQAPAPHRQPRQAPQAGFRLQHQKGANTLVTTTRQRERSLQSLRSPRSPRRHQKASECKPSRKPRQSTLDPSRSAQALRWLASLDSWRWLQQNRSVVTLRMMQSPSLPHFLMQSSLNTP